MNYIWLDLETTGLEDAVDAPHAAILEIGLIAVDNRLNEVAHWSTAIRPAIDTINLIKRNPGLCELHSNSGLLGVLDADQRTMLRPEAGGLPLRAAAEDIAMQFVAAYGGRGATMAGANPGFDKTWLRRHMPALLAMFHYRPYDTNFPFMSEAWLAGLTPTKGEVRHRVLDDCRQSIATVRRFFGLPT